MQFIQRGFSLLELMIVVAIVGILSAIAIPAYSEYMARSQVGEALSLLSAGKVPLSTWRADKGRWPSAADSVIGTTSGKYTRQIQLIAPGASSISIEATMRGAGSVSASISGASIVLATTNLGKSWTCVSGSIDTRYLPQACR